MKNVKDINCDIIEGRMLLTAVARITSRYETNLHPDQCLQDIAEKCKEIFPDTQNGIPETMKILVKALKEDPDYYMSWQANIAMAFKDEFSRHPRAAEAVNSETVHVIANTAAKDFLNLLIKHA